MLTHCLAKPNVSESSSESSDDFLKKKNITNKKSTAAKEQPNETIKTVTAKQEVKKDIKPKPAAGADSSSSSSDEEPTRLSKENSVSATVAKTTAKHDINLFKKKK